LAVPEAALVLVVGGPLELALTPAVLVSRVTFIVLEVAPLRCLLVEELLFILKAWVLPEVG
jgi:hypothetical protein